MKHCFPALHLIGPAHHPDERLKYVATQDLALPDQNSAFKLSGYIDDIFHTSYIPYMEWAVEYTDEFEMWWECLTEAEQVDISATIELLESRGPQLPFPYSSGINNSKL